VPEIKISEGKGLAKAIAPGGGSVLKQADGTLGDVFSIITKIEKISSHLENIVGMFRGREGAGSSIIQSKGTAPPVTQSQEIAPVAPAVAPPAAAPAVSDKNMEAYFSSPAGLQKIAAAIDKMIPLIGDLKLSEVKQAITDNIPGEKPKKIKSKGGKKK